MTDRATLVLRLAGPLQSWGTRSEFNRRDTDLIPSKSGVVGLLAAAQGRRRGEDISDLVGLRLGVRVDAAGSILRDYHTVSDYRGRPLLSSATLGSGAQKLTSPAKLTHVTERFYLQDATFVAAVEGPSALVVALSEAVRHPVFPLALGRRACVPVQPMVVAGNDGDLWPERSLEVLRTVPWQLAHAMRRRLVARRYRRSTIDLAVTVEVTDGPELVGADMAVDVPRSFAPTQRAFRSRRIRHDWVTVPTGFEDNELPPAGERGHDPFELLGWS